MLGKLFTTDLLPQHENKCFCLGKTSYLLKSTLSLLRSKTLLMTTEIVKEKEKSGCSKKQPRKGEHVKINLFSIFQL